MLRRLIALLLAFWLPVQVAVAVVMPFCQHDKGMTHAVRGYGESDHCNPAADKPASGPDEAAAAFVNADCDQCGLCHLAHSGFAPAQAFRAVAAPEGQAAAPRRVDFRTAFAEFPDRPPMPAPSGRG
ncbi:MAG: DUF2946 family protein [Pseudomonadota bacterium]